MGHTDDFVKLVTYGVACQVDLLRLVGDFEEYPWFERCPCCDAKSSWREGECCPNGTALRTMLDEIRDTLNTLKGK